MKEGTCAQSVSQVSEVWKGRYKGEEVALKVIGVPHLRRRRDRRNGHEARMAKSVSVLRDLKRGGRLVPCLTDITAILQGSSVDEAG